MSSAPPSPVSPAVASPARRLAAGAHSRAALAVAALTVAGMALRLAAVDQALFGDELFLHAIVADGGLGDVLSEVHDTESTPPLHFLLAWASAQLGDPTIWVRAPSLALGSATIPLVYLLGVRTVGRFAALVGTALVALSPFAIFYSVEGRAYATLGFLSALSTLLLLAALERPGRRLWVAFGACSCAVLYTHYAGVFLVAAQGVWLLAAHRERLRAAAFTYAGIALAYAPWIPSFLVQRQDSAANRIELLYPLTPQSAGRGLLNLFLGQPISPLRELPGRLLVAVFCAGLGAAAVAVALRLRRGGPRLDGSSPVSLLAVGALATPLGALAFSLGPTSVYLPRNLMPALPALALLAGLLLARSDGWLRPAALAAVLVPVCAGAAMTLEADQRRPPYREAAELIDERARPSDLVAETPLLPLRRPSPLRRDLEVHFARPHAVLETHLRPRAAWEMASPGERVFAVGAWRRGLAGAPEPPADLSRRFRRGERELLPGTLGVEIVTYVRRPGPE